MVVRRYSEFSKFHSKHVVALFGGEQRGALGAAELTVSTQEIMREYGGEVWGEEAPPFLVPRTNLRTTGSLPREARGFSDASRQRINDL